MYSRVMAESSKLYSIIKGLQCIIESWVKVQNFQNPELLKLKS